MNLRIPGNLAAISILLWTMFILPSCDDIFVEDISKDTFQLLSPSSGSETDNNQVKFRWSEVSGATGYQLEVATPGFSAGYELVFDTLLSSNRCDTTLQTGTYGWRVRAVNSEYSTAYFTSSFSILPEFNISGQKVVLQSPEDQSSSSENNITFKWDSIEGAAFYSLRIKENSWTGDSVYGARIYLTGYSISLDDGTYAWGVAAVDTVNGKQTDYTVRTLTIDQTAPGIPRLLSPANQDTVYNPLVNLIWNKSEDEALYHLEVYSDSELKNMTIEKQLADTSTYITLEDQGMYFWRVKASDRIGNAGSFSPVSVFEVRLPSDISNESVQLLAPADKSTSVQNKVTFWWNETEGAESYRIQVVTPSFTNPQKLAYNQLSDSCSVTMNLDAGDYQWRVKAINSKYETKYTTASFSVYGTDLSNQEVSLLSPLYDAVINQSPVHFTWDETVSGAGYKILIKEGSWDSGSTVYETTTSQTEAKAELGDGTYIWGVKATDPLNNTSTGYSVRPLTIDLTKPEAPQLKTPANNLKTEEYTIGFSWEAADETDNDLDYTLEIYQVKSSSVVQLTGKTTTQESVSYNFDTAGTYKWRVYATDNAGNKSDYSEYRFFEIQNEVNLSATNVNLISPADNLSTTTTSITFWWDEVSNAETYDFQLVTPSFSSVESVIKNTEQTGTEIQISLSAGTYQWRVRAKNDSSKTGYTTRTLVITQ